jgi:hypothetical protein
LYPNEKGYTEDTTINIMRLEHTKKEKTVRYDQLYHYYPKTPSIYSPFSCEIIGKETIGDGLWISDHFGLLSTFKKK